MTPFEKLSQRENDVAELLIQGKSNKQIASTLKISVRTAEFHLSSIYAKLGVTSRTEAALKLADALLRESTGNNLRESVIDEFAQAPDNGRKTISRRLRMRKSLLLTTGAFLVIILTVTLALANSNAVKIEVTLTLPESTPTQIVSPSTPIQNQSISSEHILEQIYQLSLEYDQAVQAEKQNGDVEIRHDSTNGNEVFFFKNQSNIRISELFEQFLEEKTHLENLYVKIYRDNLQPTPFPTQSSTEQDKAYYDFLVEQADSYCSLESWQNDNQAQTVQVYDPFEGKYTPLYMGDVVARCEVYGQMLEEFRVAPLMAKINHEVNIEMLHQILGNPNARFSFKTIAPLANAPAINTAVYTDETGAKYFVDIETSQLVSIETNFSAHPDISSPDQTKSIDELRLIAEQFAFANSAQLAELQPLLLYEENNKDNVYFFRWDYRNKDWSGTEWKMMPPLLQIGMLQNGQIVTYINTLDLVQK